MLALVSASFSNAINSGVPILRVSFVWSPVSSKRPDVKINRQGSNVKRFMCNFC